MYRVALIAAFLLLSAAAAASCGGNTLFQDPAGSGGAGAGAGGADAGGASARGGDGGQGGAACQSFGDPCTTCAVSPGACSDSYCACLASPDCSALWSCYLDCEAGDEACNDACELDSPAGYVELLGVFDCLGSSCSLQCGGAMPLGMCAQCAVVQCDAPIENCIGDDVCNEYVDCVNQCTDQGCLAACYAAASDTTTIDAYLGCLGTSCGTVCGGGGSCQGFGDPCTDCAYASNACNGSYCDCLATPDCGPYGQCIDACAPMDQTCADNCELAFGAGYSAFWAMADCMGSDCSADCGFGALPICFGCIVGDCSAETDACQLDVECNEYLDCEAACTNPGCQIQCYNAMSDSSEADALIGCIASSCSGACSGGSGGMGGAGGGSTSGAGGN